jgi:hypothetical protein
MHEYVYKKKTYMDTMRVHARAHTHTHPPIHTHTHTHTKRERERERERERVRESEREREGEGEGQRKKSASLDMVCNNNIREHGQTALVSATHLLSHKLWRGVWDMVGQLCGVWEGVIQNDAVSNPHILQRTPIVVHKCLVDLFQHIHTLAHLCTSMLYTSHINIVGDTLWIQ